MTRKEKDAILAAAAAIIAEDSVVHETTDEAAARKARPSTRPSTRRSTRPASATASAARKPAKEAPELWIVRKSWKGQEARPRMIGAALYWGCSAAAIEGLDKLDLSKAIAKQRGIKVKVEA